MTDKDRENCQLLAASGTALDELAYSLAPSIHGHDLVKQGLVLQLLGGRERVLANGEHMPQLRLLSILGLGSTT